MHKMPAAGGSDAVIYAGRQRIPPAPGSSGALRSTYADYIHELQQSGASNGNRLALHAGRQHLVTHHAHHQTTVLVIKFVTSYASNASLLARVHW